MDDVFPAARAEAAPTLFPMPVSGLVRVIDTETAGWKLEEDAVIEIGSVDLDLATGAIGNPMQTLVHPGGIAINPHARRIHQISDEMLVGAPPFAEAILPFLGVPAYAAQRASFDRSRLRFPGIWLCTYKLALRAFPDVRAHGLQSLVKYVPLDLSPVAGLLAELHPHRALYDAACTAVLLKTIAESLMPRCDGLADFLDRARVVSEAPALLAKFRFGRHKGVPVAEVPSDYLEWLVAEPGMDADARFTALHQLKLRGVRGGRRLPDAAVPLSG